MHGPGIGTSGSGLGADHCCVPFWLDDWMTIVILGEE